MENYEELRHKRDMLLNACKAYIRVVDSEAFRAWEGAAQLTHIRAGTKGYEGEFLPTEAIRAAIIENIKPV